MFKPNFTFLSKFEIYVKMKKALFVGKVFKHRAFVLVTEGKMMISVEQITDRLVVNNFIKHLMLYIFALYNCSISSIIHRLSIVVITKLSMLNKWS